MSRPVIEIQGFRELQENKTSQTLGIRKRNFTDPEASAKPTMAKGFITNSKTA
jgi:hypothetical protein